jgi:hypothetical protein
MKKLVLALFGILSIASLYAQKIEVSVQANSGLFHYSGISTTSSSDIILAPESKNNYTNNPYGNKNGFSYGFDVHAQLVTKSGFIIGLQTGYDILRSKEDLTGVHPLPVPSFDLFANYVPIDIPGKGEMYLQDQFINLNPYIGYRLAFKKVKVDILPGADIAINVNSYDKGKVTTDESTVYQTDLKRANAPADVRLKLGLSATYNRFGIMASYACGLTNYEKNVVVMLNITTKAGLCV